jgi:hypothetical protein
MEFRQVSAGMVAWPRASAAACGDLPGPRLGSVATEGRWRLEIGSFTGLPGQPLGGHKANFATVVAGGGGRDVDEVAAQRGAGPLA